VPELKIIFISVSHLSREALEFHNLDHQFILHFIKSFLKVKLENEDIGCYQQSNMMLEKHFYWLVQSLT
jgi:hypothetical protein